MDMIRSLDWCVKHDLMDPKYMDRMIEAAKKDCDKIYSEHPELGKPRFSIRRFFKRSDYWNCTDGHMILDLKTPKKTGDYGLDKAIALGVLYSNGFFETVNFNSYKIQ